jgi:hypothetical protein
MSRRDLPLFRHHHEPVENQAIDGVNVALDRIEADAREVIAAGGEAALRARLARLLGEGPPPGTTARAGRRRPAAGASS